MLNDKLVEHCFNCKLSPSHFPLLWCCIWIICNKICNLWSFLLVFIFSPPAWAGGAGIISISEPDQNWHKLLQKFSLYLLHKYCCWHPAARDLIRKLSYLQPKCIKTLYLKRKQAEKLKSRKMKDNWWMVKDSWCRRSFADTQKNGHLW